MMTRWKVCGLTRLEDAQAAVVAGADFLGLVFAENSPRRVRPADLDWLEAVRGDAELVGVFRDQPADFVRQVALDLDLDLVQLHGQETGDSWRNLPVRILEGAVVADSIPEPRLPGLAWGRLLDGGAGDGRTFDWKLALGRAKAERLFVAGGLSSQNVGEVVRRLRPFAVDVSSALESAPGIKDPMRIQDFARALQEADADE
jgi:phosphoribosylanthranilate isomerase